MIASSLSKALVWGRGRALRAMADALPTGVIFQHGDRRSRAIALTFDDGPGPRSGEYLEVLDRLAVNATFFVIGERCAPHAGALAEMARRGHEIAGHGWSHTPFPKLGSAAIERELAMTAAVLPPPLGAWRLVRPPYGRMTPRSLAASAMSGYTSAMWSFDPLDWQASSAADVVAAISPAKLTGGDIVLLHEERTATLEALPTVVGRVRDAGFELVTVSEMLRR
jgi:peptidoglycan/xylan/chitin deacetylase (PgdA/CDA1 family)